jgi:hypothetical protein
VNFPRAVFPLPASRGAAVKQTVAIVTAYVSATDITEKKWITATKTRTGKLSKNLFKYLIVDNRIVDYLREKLTVSELSQGLSLICWEACDHLVMLTHDPVTWSMWSDVFSYQEHNYQLAMYLREEKMVLQMINLRNSKGMQLSVGILFCGWSK